MHSLSNKWPQLLLWNKSTFEFEKKKLFPAIKHSNLQKKMFFQERLLWIAAFSYELWFTKIFVHLSEIAAECYFSVYRLIGWDPVNICFFKVNRRNTRKMYDICPKLTINTLESRSVILNIFYTFLGFSLLTLSRLRFVKELSLE